MKVQEGRYYTNGAGLIRKLERFDWVKDWRGSHKAAIYRQVSADGAESEEKNCAISTMEGWAKNEYDPDSRNFRVKVRRVRPDAILPTYATAGAAAFDLYAAEDGVIPPGQIAKIPLGLAFEIPEGHALIVAMRSGIAFNTPLRQPNGIGIIDSDYRGEVAMLFDNTDLGDFDDDGNKIYARVAQTLDGGEQTWDVGLECPIGTYLVRKGDRVAQGFVMPLPRVEFSEVNKLGETDRGTGGFGSTGIVELMGLGG